MSDESRWDSHPAGCKCPPCYYSDDEPFMGVLAKAMPRPSVIRSEVERVWRDENDRLRARVAELEAAGDRFAVAAEHVSSDINSKHEFLSEILDDEIHRWRVVRGEGSQ